MTVLAAIEVASVMDTRTPGMAAPASPFTVPVIEPPATCALTAQGAPSDAHRATIAKRMGISLAPFTRGLNSHMFQQIRTSTKRKPHALVIFISFTLTSVCKFCARLGGNPGSACAHRPPVSDMDKEENLLHIH
jgi:hypothetical protein